ncbi:hypothetical protein [Spiroplasma sp. BIUS-1]|uniref:hypothetical protein n=1 Tax=Spiroplasma sp. BIUS-1 TaxID=216964 RepID=UPI0013976501|nr:hypothetical protein [Spiroplasma sp. BIUS-1]QHX36503.1 hypothetical protein SBIUS_v1c02500 [Spiroplasma sp. BIUS-1]
MENTKKEFMNQQMKIGYAFMIVGTVLSSFLLIPLLWTIPMTLKTKSLITVYRDATVLGVCAILFVSTLGGIFILLANNPQNYKEVVQPNQFNAANEFQPNSEVQH